MSELEELIKENIELHGESAKGWQACLHIGCDHGRKGNRAGFNFNGDTISFQCFNCSTAAVVNVTENKKMSIKFRGVLEDFGIDKKSLDAIDFNLFLQNGKSTSQKSSKKKKIESLIPKKIDLPHEFMLLDRCKNKKFKEQCEKYLIDERGISPDEYPFMVCDRVNNLGMKSWEQRLIIPIINNDNIVFYQGRDMTGYAPSKYLNASGSNIDREKLLSNYDVLFEKLEKPLYIVEGWFDAHLLDGIALFGNRIMDGQRAWIGKSHRDKIFIPDRYGDGVDIAKSALELGWKISVPYAKLDENIKDVTDMVVRYGKLFTLKQIKKHTSTSITEGNIMLSLL